MRIRLTVLAPAILAIGTVGALMSGPVVAALTPAVAVAAPAAKPGIIGYHT